MARFVKKKGKPIMKGSSGSNPAMRTHRARARAKRSQPLGAIGEGAQAQRALTIAALAAHTRHTADADDAASMHIDVHPARLSAVANAVVSEPAATLLTTDDVNVIFRPVRRMLNARTQNQKEVCAVLAAVTESIRDKGLDDTPTAYWAALMATLELSSTKREEAVAVTAITYLLNLVSPHVPPAVRAKQADGALAVLGQTLKTFTGQDGCQALLRSTLSCIRHVLTVLEPPRWSQPKAQQALRALLALALDKMPKVRHAAVEAVSELFDAAPEHVLPRLQQLAQEALDKILGAQTQSKSGSANLLHALNLLRQLLPFMATAYIEGVLKLCGRLLQQNAANVPQMVYALVLGLMQHNRAATLAPSILTQALDLLLRHQPSRADVQQRGAWNRVAASTIARLAERQPSLAYDVLPQFVASSFECYLGHKDELAITATALLCATINSTVPAFLAVATNAASGFEQQQAATQALEAFVEAVASGLQYRYQTCYPLVMQVLAASFQAMGQLSAVHLGKVVQSLAELHETDDIQCQGDIESAIGAAVQAMGPDALLSLVPLGIDTENFQTEFPRAWLLPVLAEHIKGAELAYFGQNMLPLADKLKELGVRAKAENREATAAAYRQLWFQVWSLLPGFCYGATDLEDSFPRIAKLLGTALMNGDDPRMQTVICTALQKCVATAVGDEKATAAVARFSKNFLPLLFNAVVAAESSERQQPFLQAVEAFARLSETALVAQLFKSLLAKLLVTEESSNVEDVRTRHALMELAVALAPAMNAESCTLFYRLLRPQLKSTDETLQKKSYKALYEICSGNTPTLREFTGQHLSEIADVLKETTMLSAPGSKAYRLKCISSVVEQAPAAVLGPFAQELLAEIILGVKETNEKARQEAYDLIVSLGRRLPDTGAATLDGYFLMMVAGLAGVSSHMVSASILALARCIYEFHNELSPESQHQLVDAGLVLLGSPAREILRSALGFIGMVLSVMNKAEFEQHLEPCLKALGAMPKAEKFHFKSRVRTIFSRLIRRYGFEKISQLAAEVDQKLVQHIRKVAARKERLAEKMRTEGGADDDGEVLEGTLQPKTTHHLTFEQLMSNDDDAEEGSDTELDDVGARAGKRGKQSVKANKKKVTAGRSVYLEDDAEDEAPMDLLDNKTVGRIKAVQSNSKRSAKERTLTGDDIKIGPDGRFIVEDLEAVDGKAGGRKTLRLAANAADDDDDEPVAAGGEDGGLSMGTGIHRDRKGARTARNSAADNENADEDGPRAKRAAQVLPGRSTADGGPGAKPASNKPKLLGAEFRSKKAAGDMKKKDKPDPYAYLPLDISTLNRRKRAQHSSSFKGIIKSTAKGAKQAREKSRLAGRRKGERKARPVLTP